MKLKRTYENLEEVELVLREIEPRLRMLKRAISRLEQREEVEKELHGLQWTYYGGLWNELKASEQQTRTVFDRLEKDVKAKRDGMLNLENKLEAIAKAEVGDGKVEALQNQYRLLQRHRAALRDQEFALQKEIELSKVRVQSSWAPLPLPDIIGEVKALIAEKNLATLYNLAKALLKKLERPAPEDIKPDAGLLKKLDEVGKAIKKKEEELKALEAEIDRQAHESKKERTELFEIQKQLREQQAELYVVEQKRNELQIELARLEERKANLAKEIDAELKDRAEELKSAKASGAAVPETLGAEIQKLKYKLELIGGIDPESIKEYGETKERFEFLDGQVSDLRAAIKETEKVIDELDEKIAKQSEKQFKEINREFQRYFKVLFGGGSCALVQMTADETTEMPEKAETAEGAREAEDKETLESIGERVKFREDGIVGIEIQATPPGKKLKALNLLSGGERALTSIALLSAIMATNPSPFVVLDEVDAALDEANTVRFAAILEELRKLTQFIVITHNRATMERADIIYGVTMGDDGISNLLSVNLEEVEKNGTARR
ncbi:MAG: AAA family ATPase [Patescibacteria group bacterium]